MLLHPANVYVAPDESSQRSALVGPGHEVVIAERSGPWVRVFANTDVKDAVDDRDEPEFNDEDPTPASGWIHDKGIVTPTTPNGDKILYGAAANYEFAASQPHARGGRGFGGAPDLPAGGDVFPRFAAGGGVGVAVCGYSVGRSTSATSRRFHRRRRRIRRFGRRCMRGEMKLVMKRFPGSPQAAKAAYEVIDNKLCGDWQGLPKCPEQESSLYEKYAEKNPAGPRTAEALYEATFRQGSLVAMYEVEENHKRALNAAGAYADAGAERMRRRSFRTRTLRHGQRRLLMRVQQNIPVFGNDRD